jgi:hypothetical protein
MVIWVVFARQARGRLGKARQLFEGEEVCNNLG